MDLKAQALGTLQSPSEPEPFSIGGFRFPPDEELPVEERLRRIEAALARLALVLVQLADDAEPRRD